MNLLEILKLLKENFPQEKFIEDSNNSEAVYVEENNLYSLVKFIKENQALCFDYLIFITAIDYKDYFELVYYFYSYSKNHRLALKVKLPLSNLQIKSISNLYATADWNEREIYDLFGIKFLNHPDLRRILMPEDWEGYPLRKNYTYQNLIIKPD
ncbi:MAG: NADH-quinone oxidoreductase subunit C [Armatimonadetes bacterium]|nr:NADH-quinone oxidoreductase subunit C [Armatimonadota bacterium]